MGSARASRASREEYDLAFEHVGSVKSRIRRGEGDLLKAVCTKRFLTKADISWTISWSLTPPLPPSRDAKKKKESLVV